ncbi:MAG: tyrosine-type recombinase/integrase [Thermoplasmata archaeon]
MDRTAWNLLDDSMKDAERMKMCHGTVWLSVRNAGRRAKLRLPIFPHALRAYSATKWAGRIQNPFTLMELMGWETPGVAMRYIATTGKRAQRAVRGWKSSGSPA